MKWHRRLDEEEAEVLNLERQLLRHNNVPSHVVEQQEPELSTAKTSPTTKKLTAAVIAVSETVHSQDNNLSIRTPEKKRAIRARKMEKRLKEIDKSLRELSHISTSSTTSVVIGQSNNEKEDSVSSVSIHELDFVRTTGLKLNKLWKRLTSQQIEKFEPTRRYKLCKSDLERLYEEAKMAVLRDFAEDEERIAKELLEKSVSNLSTTTSPTGQIDLPATVGDKKIIEVPMLNLNFSSGHSEAEEESANNSQVIAIQQGNYSPSAAEQNFKAQVFLNSSASSETNTESQVPEEEKRASRLENNVQMFLALSQRIQTSNRRFQASSSRHTLGAPETGRLHRSLSDTDISDTPKFKTDKTTTSQKNIATITSHSNANTTNNNSARPFDVLERHQKSKSSIAEMTYIPTIRTEMQTNYTDFSHTSTHLSYNYEENIQNEIRKDLEKPNNHSTSRSSVTPSVDPVTPIKSSQQTSSDIATITEDSKSSSALKKNSMTKESTVSQSLNHKLTYSGQIGTDAETKAKEISSKLDEISAAVTQLSQMNALPSYESVTHSHSKHKSAHEVTNDESNLSTDASSYSFNFDNITTDKHSSPGTSALYSNSIHYKTITSKTYKNDHNGEGSETKDSSSHTHSGTSLSSINSTMSKTYTKDVVKPSSETLSQSMLENHILDNYEADFESDLSNVTHIEDITVPNFETTVETSQDEDAELSSSKLENVVIKHSESADIKVSDKTYNTKELENSLLPLNSEKSSSPGADIKSHKSITDIGSTSSLPPPPPPLSTYCVTAPPTLTSTTSATSNVSTSNPAGSNHLMPDIINELELRRHQLILDNEHLKQYEHVTAVPYMYVREIPNKPPPPYVPPAHGSPMTTIFPSEDRIKDITFRRSHELYCQLLKIEYCNDKGEKLASVMEEQITNIYERIILDICREYLEEHGEILRDGDPTNFHSQLAFFNPPNRLRCIQDAIYKEVRTCLAMDKTQPKRTQIYSVYGQSAKQDHIGKIIIQEMYDEDNRWCSFYHEESEVLHLMVEEMINKNLAELAKEVLLEEGGIIEEKEHTIEDNAASFQIEETSQFDQCVDEEKNQEQSKLELQKSSILMGAIDERDETYWVTENNQECSVLKPTSRIESDPQESVNEKSANIATTINSVQTCS